jgi:hypothetical protein
MPTFTELDCDIAHDVGLERAIKTFCPPITVDKLRNISEEALSFAGFRNPLFVSWLTGHMHGREAVRKLFNPPQHTNTPYPWCPQPDICQHRGSCPRGCGD